MASAKSVSDELVYCRSFGVFIMGEWLHSCWFPHLTNKQGHGNTLCQSQCVLYIPNHPGKNRRAEQQ